MSIVYFRKNKREKLPGRLAIYDDSTFKETTFNLIQNDMIGTITPSYNIPPTLPIPALLNNGNYLYTHFGFLPSWAKDKKSLNINARSETVFEKQTFRDAFRYQRCIIPLNGFYEWEVESKDKTKTKIPYFVYNKTNEFLAVAGLWSQWYDSELNMNIVTTLLITCDANDKLGKIHHRMPVVLEPKDFQTWLQSDDLKTLNDLMKIYPSEKLQLYEVTSEVNKVLYNEPQAIEKVVKEESGQLSLF